MFKIYNMPQAPKFGGTRLGMCKVYNMPQSSNFGGSKLVMFKIYNMPKLQILEDQGWACVTCTTYLKLQKIGGSRSDMCKIHHMLKTPKFGGLRPGMYKI